MHYAAYAQAGELTYSHCAYVGEADTNNLVGTSCRWALAGEVGGGGGGARQVRVNCIWLLHGRGTHRRSCWHGRVAAA